MDFFFFFLVLHVPIKERGKTSWRLITLIVVLLWIEHSFGVLLAFPSWGRVIAREVRRDGRAH